MKTTYLSVFDVEKDAENINKAGAAIAGGKIVAIPTETVYGLAANALDENAVKRVFEAKGRPQDNPMIVHIASFSDLSLICDDIPKIAKKLADRFWPGPLTMVVPRGKRIPSSVCAGLDTVAVRCPSHKVASAIIRASKVPVAAPSANTSGRPSPTTASHVIADMDGKIDMIVDGGASDVGLESTVLDITASPPRLLRPGGVTPDEIQSVVGEITIDKAVTEKIDPRKPVRSPGMKYRHYAPRAPITIVDGAPYKTAKYILSVCDRSDGVLCFDEFKDMFRYTFCVSYGPYGDSAKQAFCLFDALRSFDETDVKRIFAQAPDASGVGLAVSNRLRKAAGFSSVTAPRMRVIGLTGRSGSGKSEASDVMESLGAVILDADRIYNELTSSSVEMRNELSARFGDIYLDSGNLDRAKLAKIVFSDASALSDLNLIAHKYVVDVFKARLSDLREKGEVCAVIDAPLLFESGADALCDIVLGVISKRSLSMERIMLRDKLSEENADMRISSQPDDEFYRNACDIIIENNASISKFHDEVASFYKNFILTRGDFANV